MENRAIFSGKTLAYLLVLPQLAISLIFFYWPAAQALWQSFLVQDAFGLSTEFVWFENYVNLLQTPEYYHAIGVTCHYGRSVGRRHGITCQKVKGQSVWVLHFGPNWETKSEQRVKQSVFSDLDELPAL